MKALIVKIFGSYEPITYEVFEYDSDGVLRKLYDAIPQGLGGVDWEYVLGVLGFFLVLYCILRIIGGVINRV